METRQWWSSRTLRSSPAPTPALFHVEDETFFCPLWLLTPHKCLFHFLSRRLLCAPLPSQPIFLWRDLYPLNFSGGNAFMRYMQEIDPSASVHFTYYKHERNHSEFRCQRASIECSWHSPGILKHSYSTLGWAALIGQCFLTLFWGSLLFFSFLFLPLPPLRCRHHKSPQTLNIFPSLYLLIGWTP